MLPIILLAKRSALSLLCIDEIHTFSVDVSFRKEMLGLKEDLFRPISLSGEGVLKMDITGTATDELLEDIQKNTELKFDCVMLGGYV